MITARELAGLPPAQAKKYADIIESVLMMDHAEAWDLVQIGRAHV